MIKWMLTKVKTFFERDRLVESYKGSSGLSGKTVMQLIIAIAFLILSVANIVSRSYIMLIFTVLGCVANLVFSYLAKKLNNVNICTISSIASCSVLFGYFVVYGGNDGFSCQWVVLLPLISMVAMSFRIGLYSSIFFQVFLIVVFWTPIRDMLLYRYNDQFCLRFPLFFFVTFVLGLLFTVTVRTSEYNEYMHLLELEKLNSVAQELARTDPLTKLANRRFAYEEFDAKYVAKGQPHCIIMGDIDGFKQVNDTYGHEFGDEVLTAVAEMINRMLPYDYLKSRWGGEEFLFAANVTVEEAYAKTERLRKAIAEHCFICKGKTITITFTFGIAKYDKKEELIGAISTADRRLYAGKRASKNCTVTDG